MNCRLAREARRERFPAAPCKPAPTSACPDMATRRRHLDLTTVYLTVHALKVDKLDVGADTIAAMIGFLTHMNSLGKAEIVTRFGSA